LVGDAGKLRAEVHDLTNKLEEQNVELNRVSEEYARERDELLANYQNARSEIDGLLRMSRFTVRLYEHTIPASVHKSLLHYLFQLYQLFVYTWQAEDKEALTDDLDASKQTSIKEIAANAEKHAQELAATEAVLGGYCL